MRTPAETGCREMLQIIADTALVATRQDTDRDGRSRLRGEVYKRNPCIVSNDWNSEKDDHLAAPTDLDKNLKRWSLVRARLLALGALFP